MSGPQDLADWLMGQGGTAALLLARTLGLALSAPGWGTPVLGWRIRLALAGLLTILLLPAIGPGLSAPGGGLGLGRAALAEATVGAALGMSAGLVVAAARQAGEVVGGQAGLSAASLLDPEAGDGMTPLGHLYGSVALGVFLALDGPLRLVGVLAESYRVVPAGGLALSRETVETAFARVGRSLELALQAAVPSALALASAGLALGLLSRATPSVQRLGLALPARAVVGLVLVLLGLGALSATLGGAWDAWFAGEVLGAAR